MSSPILPGQTLGMLGSGQLGRMFAISARRLGYQVHVFSPEANSPTGQVADREYVASYDDEDALAEFARHVDVVSFEFENVPAATSEIIGRHTRMHPNPGLLHITQNRLREKQAIQKAGLPLARFASVTSDEELRRAVEQIGCPAVLKTASSGYDGKGQVVIRRPEDADSAWTSVGRAECVLEEMIGFQCELSVVAARNASGAYADYGPILNTHANHILDVSMVPAGLPDAVTTSAREITRSFFEQLDVVGVTCIEFFLDPERGLLINEVAPRPHNSGHLTIDAHMTCQFEQQVRAICGLPLGAATLRQPAAMANLLGDLWIPGEPDWVRLLAERDVKLHLYGKREARAGRKMGHLTVLSRSAAEAAMRASRLRNSLANPPEPQAGETA